jgi:hypothetical protein
MFEVKCDICQTKNIIDTASPVASKTEQDHNKCYACGNVLKFKIENVFINKPFENKEDETHYQKGTIVIITNKEHPWYDDLAIIRGRKHKHHRIELHGIMIWVPNHWIKLNEPIDDDA